jgi:glycosyltransferase involved in cell wall biosynthesis
MAKNAPDIVVIIPAYNCPESLDALIDALEQQTLGHDRFRVVVVDNGSDPELNPKSAGTLQLEVIRETQPGSYAARNRAIRETDEPFIAFTDADCLPAPEWLESGFNELIDSDGNTIFAGGIRVFASQTPPSPVEKFELLTAFPIERYVTRANFGPTANLFVPRSAFDDVGLFDSERRSGGDSEWGLRAVRGGWNLEYLPAAYISHPARESWDELSGKVRRVAGGRALTSRKHSAVRFGGHIVKNLLFPPVTELLSNLRHAAEVRGQPRRYIAPAFAVGMGVHYLTQWEMLRVRMGARARR